MSLLQPAQPLLDWSFPLFRLGRIAVRMHWTLPPFMIFEAIRHVTGNWPLWTVVPILGVIWLSVLLHELGHAAAAIVVGGDCRRIVLWVLGGWAECDRPFRPAPVAIVSAAGPAVNAAIYAACELTLRFYGPDRSAYGEFDWLSIVGYARWINLIGAVFNLLPALPLDGSKVWIAGVWTVFGLRFAQRSVLATSYLISIGIFLMACYYRSYNSSLALLLSLWMLSTAIQEHAALRQGWSTQGFDPAYGMAPSPFARWRSRRRRHRRARQDAKAAAERDLVDGLLAKVSANGLASLSKKERALLEAYSRRERQRLGRE